MAWLTAHRRPHVRERPPALGLVPTASFLHPRRRLSRGMSFSSRARRTRLRPLRSAVDHRPDRRTGRGHDLPVLLDIAGPLGGHLDHVQAAAAPCPAARPSGTPPSRRPVRSRPPYISTTGSEVQPVGVPKSSSKCSRVPAWGRNEKMPPPSLLISTMVASSRCSLAASRPFKSW